MRGTVIFAHMEQSMKPVSLRLVIGFLIYTAGWCSYKLLFQNDIAWPEILSMSFLMSLGQEFVVPQMVKWGQARGWVSKQRMRNES